MFAHQPVRHVPRAVAGEQRVHHVPSMTCLQSVFKIPAATERLRFLFVCLISQSEKKIPACYVTSSVDGKTGGNFSRS